MEGGTCLRGESNLFIHCIPLNTSRESINYSEKYSTWSEWTTQKYCDTRTDYFKTKWRNCIKSGAGKDYEARFNFDEEIKNQITYKPFCRGSWLNVNIQNFLYFFNLILCRWSKLVYVSIQIFHKMRITTMIMKTIMIHHLHPAAVMHQPENGETTMA